MGVGMGEDLKQAVREHSQRGWIQSLNTWGFFNCYSAREHGEVRPAWIVVPDMLVGRLGGRGEAGTVCPPAPQNG